MFLGLFVAQLKFKIIVVFFVQKNLLVCAY